jgi:hypothetical protein
MVAVYNSFETGTLGSTITAANTGGGSNTALDAVTIGTGASVTFGSNGRGALSAQLNAGTTPADAGMEWSTAVGTLTTWYQRIYYYATSHPTNQHRILDSTTAGGAALCSGIYHQSAGTIAAANGSFGISCQGTVAVALNQWVRIELKTVGSATTGSITMRLYNVPDANNVTEEIVSAANQNTSGSGVIFRFGLNGDTYDTNRTIWIDDLGVSSVDWLGPATWAKNAISGASRPTPGVVGQAVSRAVTW